ncbi:helix-turn-helix domain-containing protein [Kitasatospora sp. NBC_01250]|uniref:helix-turn-helix domain-containing protein n=1 Tax=Kitasatospora sp. NBC_01250 TaxID=2903571 RepID=UPI002E340F22|nr:helix-turn-helix domain-containing protein [Kitasatospora sp. NBC_01250]
MHAQAPAQAQAPAPASAQAPATAAPAALGALLRSARRGAGLTQEQLAGLSTVSVRAIRDLEQGRVQHPRKDTIRLLADTMRLSGPRRAALQLAAASASAGSTLGGLYGVEPAPPPAPLRPLAGRGAELRALTGLLGAEHERLLTVVGLPGVGKSRLAQEAALCFHAQAQAPVLWVPMDRTAEEPATPRRPQSALVGRVRTLLGQGGHGGSLDELADVIRDRPTLLVLDGCDAAPGGRGTEVRGGDVGGVDVGGVDAWGVDAWGVDAWGPGLLGLLNSCERLKVLITTRRPERALDGRVLPLAPLPLPAGPPDPAHPGRPGAASPAGPGGPAVELMLSYVGHLRPDLLPTESVVATVARICHALDGLPQALEAAGSWLLLYSPEQLLEIVRSTPLALIDGAAPAVPGGGPGLSGLLADTLRGLSPRLAALLRAVAPLSCPWTVEAAARALGSTPTAVARDVHALLLHGLLRQLPAVPGGPARFSVLNLVRQLGAAQPTAPGTPSASCTPSARAAVATAVATAVVEPSPALAGVPG